MRSILAGTIRRRHTVARAMSSTQQFNQKVLQRYGWSASFDRDETGKWRASVIMGFIDGKVRRRCFVSESRTDDERQGVMAASQAALEGLKSDIQVEESKQQLDMAQAFKTIQLEILDSDHPETWTRFWSSSPRCVGIDVEGNQKSPPVLVQIAVDNMCILEAPRNGRLSDDLRKLLGDDSIKKIFCDNFSHKDKTSLGLVSHSRWDQTSGSIIDLEVLAAQLLGPVKVARGLGRISTLCLPDLHDIAIVKPIRSSGNIKGRFSNVSRFALIEQGKLPPLRGLQDLSPAEQRYAAVDAWLTLQCHKRLSTIAHDLNIRTL